MGSAYPARAQSLSGIGLSMFHRGGPISCRRMFPAWGGTLIGRSHLIVSHGFGDKLFSRERDFGNFYNGAWVCDKLKIRSHGFGDKLFSRERDFGNFYNGAWVCDKLIYVHTYVYICGQIDVYIFIYICVWPKALPCVQRIYVYTWFKARANLNRRTIRSHHTQWRAFGTESV